MSEAHEARQRAALALGLDDFVTQGVAALPTGPAWSREPGSVRRALLRGLLGNHAYAWERMVRLLAEADPRSAYETIEDWEADCGLPDPCIGPQTDLQDRRDAVVMKRQTRGGQSRAYYIEIARRLGFHVTIEEFTGFRAGHNSVGDAVYREGWAHAWRVTVLGLSVRYFLAGASSAGDPLARWGNTVLECVLHALKPAHTVLQIAHVNGAIWDGGTARWDGGDTIWDRGTPNAERN